MFYKADKNMDGDVAFAEFMKYCPLGLVKLANETKVRPGLLLAVRVEKGGGGGGGGWGWMLELYGDGRRMDGVD